MKDKVQKIREEVVRIQLYTQSEVLKQVLDYIDEVQKEPVSETQSSVILYGLTGSVGSSKEEPSKFDAAIQEGDDVRYNEDLGCRVNLSQLKRVAKKEEPVSEDLEKVVEEIVEPTVLNAYGVKEIANRLRRTMTGSVNDVQVKESFISKHENKTCKVNGNSLTQEPVNDDLDSFAIKYAQDKPYPVTVCQAVKVGANWQKEKDSKLIINAKEDGYRLGLATMKQQMMANAVEGDITFDYYGDDDKTYGCIAHDSFCLEDFGLKDRDKVKMILIREG